MKRRLHRFVVLWLALVALFSWSCSSSSEKGDGGATDAAPDGGDLVAEVQPSDVAGEETGEDTKPGDLTDSVPGDLVDPDISDADAGGLDTDVADVVEPDLKGVLTGKWVQLASAQLGEHVLKGVWGFDDGNVVSVGEAGLIAAVVQDSASVAHQDPSLNILNGVWGSSSADIWTAGMYGLLYHYDGMEWGPPKYCETVEDCTFAGDCLLADCVTGECVYVPTGAKECCGGQHYVNHLDTAGEQGDFEVEDLYADSPDGGLVWQSVSVTTEEGEPRYQSAPSALYFGNPWKDCPGGTGALCPDYNNGMTVGATATSPYVSLPATAEQASLTFYLFIDVEASPLADEFSVRVLNTGKWEEAWNKTQLSGNYTGQFVPIKVDLSDYIGKTIKFQFYFDSVNPENNALEGLYIDDIVVSSTCSLAGAMSGKYPTLWSIWGADTDNVFAVGNSGTVLHYDGLSWQQQAGGDPWNLLGIHGANADDIVMVGQTGLLVHSKAGTSWQEEESGTVKDVSRVWGVSPDSYVAVGAAGTLLVYEFGAWQDGGVITDASLNNVIGFAPNDYYVVGEGGIILHYDGLWWQQIETGDPRPYFGIWGDDAQSMLTIVGHQVVLKGSANALEEEYVPVTNTWTGVWGKGVHRFVVGFGGKVMYHNGIKWKEQDTGTGAGLMDVWGFSEEDVWAVGEAGTLLHFDGEQWTQSDVVASEETTYFDVWGPAPNDVYVIAAEAGMAYVLHWDGVKWEIALSSQAANLRHVHGTAKDDVFAVGQWGSIIHYDGMGWGLQPIEPYEVEGEDPYFVTDKLYGVYAHTSDNAWAVGENGVMVHYDGAAWSLYNYADATLRAVWGLNEENIWAVGASGTILHFNGSTWEPEETGSVATLYGIWGDEVGNLYAVGDKGTVLRFVSDDSL